MAAQPAIDLTDVDLVPAIRQATRFTRSATGRITGAAASAAKTTTYTAVGLGLLSWQRLQVRRREIERAMRE